MEAVYWHADPVPHRFALSGDVRADVCVIGAGIGGLATTWRLLERGLRPVVVEARAVAAGASGRNGGFFIAGGAPMYHATRDRWGPVRARAVHGATLEAQEEMLGVAAEVGAVQHFRRLGMLRLAVDGAEADDVRSHHAALRADGFPGELVDEADLPAALRRRGRIGLYLPHDGAVHPVRWLRALAAACEHRGARIFERSPVEIAPAGTDGIGVRSRTGRVLADRAVVAMDAGLAALVPAAAAVRPRRLHMLATAADRPGRLPFPVYARYGYEYAQQLPGGEVTLGGFSDLDGESSWTDREEVSARVQGRLDRYLGEDLGVRAPVTHRWVGLVGYVADALPRCGIVPGGGGRLFALGGYNGTGHVQAWVAAGIVADLVTAGDSPRAGLYAAVDAPAAVTAAP